MQRSIRHKLIIQSLQTGGRLRVEQLVELTGSSAVTIRRDLAHLEAHEALRRVPGGAARTVKHGESIPFSLQLAEDRDLKARLATAAAALIADYESVIIDNGTTCHAVAQELAGRPITALCLSLHAAVVLGSTPGARVIVPGGPVEPDTLAFLGSQAVDAVRNMRADALVLGTCSASATRGLTSTLYEDAQIKQASIQSSTGSPSNTSSNSVTSASPSSAVARDCASTSSAPRGPATRSSPRAWTRPRPWSRSPRTGWASRTASWPPSTCSRGNCPPASSAATT